MGLVILAGDEDTSGIHVNAVDDPRTQDAVDPGQILPAVVHQSVYKRARIMPGRRMDHHALGLIHQDHIAVLIKDIQGDVFSQDLRLPRLRHLKGQPVAFRHPVTGLYRTAVCKNAAGFHELLEKGTGIFLTLLRQKFIDPVAGGLLRHKDLFLHLAFSFPEKKSSSPSL